jgi:hypothetical protein
MARLVWPCALTLKHGVLLCRAQLRRGSFCQRDGRRAQKASSFGLARAGIWWGWLKLVYDARGGSDHKSNVKCHVCVSQRQHPTPSSQHYHQPPSRRTSGAHVSTTPPQLWQSSRDITVTLIDCRLPLTICWRLREVDIHRYTIIILVDFCLPIIP